MLGFFMRMFKCQTLKEIIFFVELLDEISSTVCRAVPIPQCKEDTSCLREYSDATRNWCHQWGHSRMNNDSSDSTSFSWKTDDCGETWYRSPNTWKKFSNVKHSIFRLLGITVYRYKQGGAAWTLARIFSRVDRVIHHWKKTNIMQK